MGKAVVRFGDLSRAIADLASLGNEHRRARLWRHKQCRFVLEQDEGSAARGIALVRIPEAARPAQPHAGALERPR